MDKLDAIMAILLICMFMLMRISYVIGDPKPKNST